MDASTDLTQSWWMLARFLCSLWLPSPTEEIRFTLCLVIDSMDKNHITFPLFGSLSWSDQHNAEIVGFSEAYLTEALLALP